MISRTAFVAFLCGLLALTATAVPSTITPPITFPKPGLSCAVVLCRTGTRCIETKKGPKCVPFPPPCICPAIFAPVCCKTPFGLKTTGNACQCKCGKKNKVILNKPCPTCATVRCKKGFKCIVTRFGPKCVPIIKRCLCTKEFKPVCCKLASGKIVTKNNACLCVKCNRGAKIIRKGRCLVITRPPITRPPPPPICICPAIFDPVCCKVAGSPPFTASNACQCNCRKGKVISKGRCETK